MGQRDMETGSLSGYGFSLHCRDAQRLPATR
jgi:hypothetical protein